MARTDAVHPDPVWRDRADFIIGAKLPEPDRAEQLWARRLGGRRFEICCIPFFLYDVALGDEVETGDDYELVRVVKPSGRYVFRVWFGQSFHPREAVAEHLVEMGALIEWSSANLLAIDAADRGLAQSVADYLHEQAASGLVYETGRSG
jgi:hypothetical protein